MVVTAPVTAETGITQERTGVPSMWTVQAPHWAMPQPNFVPFSFSLSRSTQSSGMSGLTSSSMRLPLTCRVCLLISASPLVEPQASRLIAWGSSRLLKVLRMHYSGGSCEKTRKGWGIDIKHSKTSQACTRPKPCRIAGDHGAPVFWGRGEKRSGA